MEMKIFIIGVFVSFLILFNSCGSTITKRYDHSIPMQESCMLNKETVNIVAFDGQGIYFGDGKRNIIPAGNHVLQGNIMVYFGEGGSKGYTYHFNYNGKEVYSSDYTTITYKKSFNFEPGKFYTITSTWINVSPLAVDEKIFIDENGNHYHYDKDPITPYIYGDSKRVTFRLWDFILKEIDGQFKETYISFEYPCDIYIGVRYPGLLGLGVGPTYGFSFFSNPINMRVYAETSIGIGMGMPYYDFSAFDNFRAGFPIMHIGGTIEFEFGKELGIGLGGGVLYTITGYSPMPDETYTTPYLQLMFGRTLDGAVAVEYYPAITPIYSGFGLSYKLRLP
jgi:hypothetical protein